MRVRACACVPGVSGGTGCNASRVPQTCDTSPWSHCQVRGLGHITEERWAPLDLGSLSFTLLNGHSAFTAAFRCDLSEWSSLRVPTCRSKSL